MNARYITALGLRLFCIWLGFSAIQLFGMAESLRKMGETFIQSPWVGFSVAGVTISIGIVLWILSRPIASLLTFDLGRIAGAEPLSASDLVTVGCVLMGLWWLKPPVVILIDIWVRVFAMTAPEESMIRAMTTGDKTDVLVQVVRIAVALFFVCRGRLIARWVLARTPSDPKPADETP